MAVDAQRPPANALKTAWDTIVAPAEAFQSIREVPTWGWALTITIVIAVIANFMMLPASEHIVSSSWQTAVASNPQLSQMSPAQQQAMFQMQQRIASFGWLGTIVMVPAFCAIGAIVMLLFDKIGRGEGSFARYFAAYANISIPAFALGNLIVALIVRVRGPQTFTTQVSLLQVMPSLGTFLPFTGKLGAFLATITPFSIWGTALIIIAMLTIGRVPKLQAWLAGIVLFLIPVLFVVAYTK